MRVADRPGCPRRGLPVDGKPHDVREMRVKGLPHRPVTVPRRNRRYRCPDQRCPQRVSAERCAQLPPRHRLTGRLRVRLEQAAPGTARALSDAAAECRVSRWSVHRALVDAAAARSSGLPPVRMPGLDETRARRVRWHLAGGTGWRLTDPWVASFVDLDTGRPGWPLGPVPGRSGAAVTGWLAAQPQPWRGGVQVVAPDPSARCAAAVRRLLPQATIVADHWHLVRLADQMPTEVRQRIAREQLGRPG